MMKRRYSVALNSEGEERVCVTVRQFPEVATFGRDHAHALEMAADAVYVAVSARLSLNMPIPDGDAGVDEELAVVIDVPLKRHRRPPVHHAAINTDTMIIFPSVEDDLPADARAFAAPAAYRAGGDPRVVRVR